MGLYNIVSAPALVAGQPEDISVVLANLQAIQTILNGGIDNSNVAGAAAILASKLAGYPTDGTKVLKGDGTWGGLTAVSAALNVGAANTDLAAPAGTDNYWVATTAGGTLRSIAAGAAGARITLKNGTAAGYIRLLHATAGGGAQLSIIGAGHKFLAPGQSIELRYDGAVWVEVNRPSHEIIFDLTLAGSQATFDTDTILGIAASIPQVYNHLRLVTVLREDDAVGATSGILRFNADAGANYDYSYVQGANSAASAVTVSGATAINNILSMGATGTAGNFAQSEVLIPAYAQAVARKIAVGESFYDTDSTVANIGARSWGGLWKNVAAITRISLAPNAGNWIAGSRITLYGLT